MSLGVDSSSQTLKDACQYADGKGMLLVAAAGNDGPWFGLYRLPGEVQYGHGRLGDLL